MVGILDSLLSGLNVVGEGLAQPGILQGVNAFTQAQAQGLPVGQALGLSAQSFQTERASRLKAQQAGILQQLAIQKAQAELAQPGFQSVPNVGLVQTPSLLQALQTAQGGGLPIGGQAPAQGQLPIGGGPQVVLPIQPSPAELAKIPTVPGFDIAKGQRPTLAEATTFKDSIRSKSILDSITDQLTNLVQTAGTETVFGSTFQKMSQLRNAATLELKELLKLGAIQAPDVPLLEATLPDPTSTSFVRSKTILQGFNNFKKLLQEKIDAEAQSKGFIRQPKQIIAGKSSASQLRARGIPESEIRGLFERKGFDSNTITRILE